MSELMFKLQPKTDEGFSSYLLRLGAANRFKTRADFYKAIGLKSLGPRKICVEAVTDQNKFSKATGLSKGDIGSLVPVFDGKGDMLFHGLKLRAHHYQTNRRRLSPTFLRSHQALHYAWQIDFLPICPISMEILLDRCPYEHCLSPLEWSICRGASYCDHCGYNLAMAQTAVLEEEDQKAVKPIFDFVFKGELERVQAAMNLPAAFRNLDGGTLLQLVAILGRADRERRGLLRNFSDKFDTISMTGEFVDGAKLLMGAPRTLKAIIDLEPEFRASSYLTRVKDLAKFGATRAVQDAMSTLEMELKPYKFDHISAIAKARIDRDLMTLSQVAAELGIPETSRIRDLVDSGYLRSETRHGQFKKIVYIKRSEFEKFRASISDRIATQDVYRKAGWKFYHLDQFVESGLLQWHSSGAIPILYNSRYVEAGAFDELVQQLREKIPRRPLEGRILLSRLFPLMGSVHKPLAPIVKTALLSEEKDFLAIVDPKSGWNPENLSLPMRYKSLVLRGNVPWSHCDFNRPFMMQEEAQEYLNILPKNLFQLIGCGELEYACVGKTSIASDTVTSVGKQYIGAWEIAARTGHSATQIPKWARDRGLVKPSVDHGLWLRDEVEVFLSTNYYLARVETMPPLGAALSREKANKNSHKSADRLVA